MVNREYIKTQIDILPDEIIISVGEFINKRIKKSNRQDVTLEDIKRFRGIVRSDIDEQAELERSIDERFTLAD